MTDDPITLLRAGDWTALYVALLPQARLWAARVTHGPRTVDTDAAAHDGIVRFWRSGVREFPTNGHLYRYLRLCVVSEVTDRARMAHPDVSLDEARIAAIDTYRDETFWRIVRAEVTPVEWLVIAERFIDGQKPQAIARCYPKLFTNAHDVSIVVRRFTERLARREAIQGLREYV